MLTAIIIDDEEKGRVALREKLKNYCTEVSLVAEVSNAIEGLSEIEKHSPDIVFLDIEMPKMDGFEMLRHLPKKEFHLIFTTAYNQYAIKAIRYAAFDYLLKPIDIEELKTAIEKISTSQSVNRTTQDNVDVLIHHLQLRNEFGKIVVPTISGLHFFNINDIIHVEAQRNYSVLYFNNHPKLTTSKTLKEFEDLLPREIFFRTHRSHLINFNYIKRYIKGDGGQIEMSDGTHIEVSRAMKEDLLKLIR